MVFLWHLSQTRVSKVRGITASYKNAPLAYPVTERSRSTLNEKLLNKFNVIIYEF